MSEWPTPTDPYESCAKGKCHHDVLEGVLIAELENGDGPYRPSHWSTDLKAALARSMNRRPKAKENSDG